MINPFAMSKGISSLLGISNPLSKMGTGRHRRVGRPCKHGGAVNVLASAPNPLSMGYG